MAKIEESCRRKGIAGKGAACRGAGGRRGRGDELLPAAVEVVLEPQASVHAPAPAEAGLPRAARLVDQMEERGIVGPSRVQAQAAADNPCPVAGDADGRRARPGGGRASFPTKRGDLTDAGLQRRFLKPCLTNPRKTYNGTIINAMTASPAKPACEARGDGASPSPRRTAATLEQSASERPSRYRMT